MARRHFCIATRMAGAQPTVTQVMPLPGLALLGLVQEPAVLVVLVVALLERALCHQRHLPRQWLSSRTIMSY